MICLRLFFFFAIGGVFFPGSNGWASDGGGFVGMQIQGMSAKLAEALGRPSVDGVLVRDVALGGPAAKAGFRRGDLIIEFSGKAIKKFEDLVVEAKKLKPEDVAKALVVRHTGEVQLSLEAGVWPASWRISKNSFATVGAAGITLASLSEKIRSRFNLRWGATGVVVTIIDEATAPKIDLKRGELIHQINQEPVWEPRRASAIIYQAVNSQKKTVLLLVEGVDGFRYVILPVVSGE